jgi:capsular exopolysaccharide synthesis family protein
VTPSNFTPTQETDFGYGQLVAVFWRRRLWLAGLFSLAVLAAIPLTLLQPPTYRSSMRLLVEPNYRSRTPRSLDDENIRVSDQERDVDYVTQLNLMRSSQFIQQAVTALQAEYPDLELADVQDSLSLSQVTENRTETKIFELVYEDSDPIKTQRVIEEIQAVYQEYNLEQQEQRLTRGLEFIDQQLNTTRQSLRQSQSDLRDFRQGQNLINPQEQATAVTAALNQTLQERQTIQAQYDNAQARFAGLQQQVALSPQAALVASRLSQSERYQQLLNELQTTDLEITEQQLFLTDADPNVAVLQEKRQTQIDLLRQEMQRVLGQAPAEMNLDGDGILQAGQLSQTDLTLVAEMASVQVEIGGLEAVLTSLTQSEQELRQELNRFPELIATYDSLEPEVEIERATLEQLLEQRQQLSAELSRGGFTWEVVEPPLLGEKTGPSIRQNLMLAAVAGLFLGGIAAFLREGMDNVVHTSDELQTQSPLPLLGVLPAVEVPSSAAAAGRAGSRAIALSVGQALEWQPFRESLDLIYKTIQMVNPAAPHRSLIVTSALPSEGKSMLTLGLALSAARMQKRVLVIDTDLRRPSLHQHCNLPNQQGLSTLLNGSTPEIRPTPIQWHNTGIDVLTAGPEPLDPVSLLGSDQMSQLMQRYTAQYDLVLVDTPPILGLADVMQVASHCDAVVMVARLDRITQTELMDAAAMLRSLNVLGLVANGSKQYPRTYPHYMAEQNGHRSLAGAGALRPIGRDS